MTLNKFAFVHEIDPDYQEWRGKVERIEETVYRVGRRDLDALARVGADRKSMVTLLALAAIEDRESLSRLMRQRQTALRSISRRMNRLAKEAKDRINDPMSIVQFWAFMNGGWPTQRGFRCVGLDAAESKSEDKGTFPNYRNRAKTRTASKIEAVSFGSHPVKVNSIIACLPLTIKKTLGS